MDWVVDGCCILPDVLTPPDCDAAIRATDSLAVDRAGSRELLAHDWCRDLVRRVRLHVAVAPLIESAPLAVQCTFFNKTAEQNWSVPFHQDLSIPVAARVAHDELTGWSNKDGTWFVQPPSALLARLRAVRVHLDACDEAAGPLRVVPGSHVYGRLDQAAVQRLRAERAEHVCTVPRGGALVLRPLLLHASARVAARAKRRVLHIVFGPRELPCGLTWGDTV